MKNLLRGLALTLCLNIFLLGTGCQHEDHAGDENPCDQGYTCVVYLETYCFEPWEQGYTSDEQLIDNIHMFLETLDVELHELKIEITSAPEPCNACSCKTGRSISGKVLDEDLPVFIEIGFVEK